MGRKWNDDDEQFVLDGLKHHGARSLKVCTGSPAAPTEGTPEYLDWLDKYAEQIVLGHPKAPPIVREGDRFVLERDRPERKSTRYKSIRTALKKVIFELSMKDAATREEKGPSDERS